MTTLIRFAILMSAAMYAAGLVGPQSAFAQEKIYWQSNPQQAANQAAMENKLVLLHFTADWCGPCQNQKRFIFSNPTVARAVNQSVIPVLVDIDVNRELAAELGVKSIPFDVFLTPGGEVVSKRNSPTDAQNFMAMVTSLRSPGPAPKGGALAKLSELKRKLDPMSYPRENRSTFGVDGPENASVGVSKEAMELGKKSNYGSKMSFLKRGRKPNKQNGENSDLQSAINALARAPQQKKGVDPKSSDQFYSIPAEREKQATVSKIPRANQQVSDSAPPQRDQRSYEILERQQFLARERAEFEIPRQPVDVKPVRVMNENFLAAQTTFGTSSLKVSGRFPGLEVSDMVDSRTGLPTQPKRNSGRSIARFKTEAKETKPSNEVRIVPSREGRIAGQVVDDSLPTQATLNRKVSSATAKIVGEDTAMSESPFVQENQLAPETMANSEPSATKSDSSESDFCLQGKCPVALAVEGKWVDGDMRWGIVHRDRTYLFSSEENYRLFQENPDHYSPVLAAYDPVALHDSGNFVDGLEENGVFMEKDQHQQIVLFSSAANREKFQTNPQLYMRSVRKALYTASRADAPGNAAATKLR